MSHLDSEIRLHLFNAEFPKAESARKNAPQHIRSKKPGFSLSRVYLLLFSVCAVGRLRQC